METAPDRERLHPHLLLHLGERASADGGCVWPLPAGGLLSRNLFACGKSLTKKASQDTHFYVVLRWHLPEEMADQLMQLARINPEGDSWEQLARRKEFELAIQISIAARENIIRRFLAECNLETKKSDGRFTHTTTDVLLPDVVATGVSNGVAFYSGCAATDREQGTQLFKRFLHFYISWETGSFCLEFRV